MAAVRKSIVGAPRRPLPSGPSAPVPPPPGAKKAGLALEAPSTAEGVVIATGLAVGGGLIGYYVGGKKYHWLGAGIGALAGLVVVPAIGSLLFQK